MSAYTTLRRTLPGALAVGGVWSLWNYINAHTDIEKITNSLKPLDSSTENRIKDIAKRMGVEESLNCYETPNPKFPPFALSQYPFGPNSIAISKTTSDFAIAHELSHLKLRHPLKLRASQAADPILAICVYNLLRMRRGRIISGIFGSMTYACSSNFGAALLRRDQEKEADLMACAFLNKKEIAKGVHEFAQEDYAEKKLQLHLLGSNMNPMFLKSVFWLKNALSSHPPSSKRMKYVKEVYYNKSNEDETPIELRVSINRKEIIKLLSPAQSQKINELIKKSSNENALLGIELILIALHDSTVQVSIFEHFLETGEGFEEVCDLLDQEFNAPKQFVLSGKYENTTPDQVIDRLRERTQGYDLDNCVISHTDSKSFTVGIKEKPIMK